MTMQALRDDDPSPVTIRRYFPAEVAFDSDGQVVRTALVIVTRVRVYVFTHPGEPAFDAPYEPSLSALPPVGVRMQTPAMLSTPDTGVWVNVERGCGCGSRVKTYQPWMPVTAANQ